MNIKNFSVDIINKYEVVTEPNYSLSKMNNYEQRYGISTEEMLTGEYSIDSIDKVDWTNCYHIAQNGVEIYEKCHR